MTKKKSSKQLVTVGAHIPLAIKVALQAIANCQGITMYKLLQRTLEEKAKEAESLESNSNTDEDLLS